MMFIRTFATLVPVNNLTRLSKTDILYIDLKSVESHKSGNLAIWQLNSHKGRNLASWR